MARFITPKYSLSIVVLGLAVLVVGIASFFVLESIVISLILVFVGSYLGLSHTGFDIKLEERRFRNFIWTFGIKEGHWKSFKYYPYLSILIINQKHTRYSTSGVPFSSKHQVFRVYLLNQKHTDKILIKEFENKISAEKFTSKIAIELNLEETVYSPDFS